MEVVKGSKELSDLGLGTVLTIGNFDGIHLGHQALIEQTVSLAKKYSLKSVVMSFRPHPIKVLFPEKELKRLFSYRDQEEVLEGMEVDFFVQQAFSRKLSELSAERFLSELIVKPLNPKAIVVGYDFAFGANREGSIGYLEKYCAQNQIELVVQSPIRVHGEVVSSSLLRKLIHEGRMDFASQCLGRSFYLEGVVEKGAGRGRQIGFPTANVFTKAESFPKVGVYVSLTSVGGITYPSITNVGKNPTFEEETRRPVQVETHILNFDADIYGDSITVEFLDFLRPEKKFGSVDDLIQQIQVDVKQARDFHDKVGANQ